jgi:hypothetical protein
MRPCSMGGEARCGRGIDAVVEPFQEMKGLPQPTDVGRNERGQASVKGRCRLHAARVSARRLILFPGIFRVQPVLQSRASRIASCFKPLRSR